MGGGPSTRTDGKGHFRLGDLDAGEYSLRIEHPGRAMPVEVDVTVRYQACDDVQCFIPRSRTLRLEVPIGPGAMPNFGGHGVRSVWPASGRGWRWFSTD